MKKFSEFISESMTIKIAKGLFDDLVAHELDTYDPKFDPPEKGKLADALEAAMSTQKLTLDDVTKKRLKYALDNLIDVYDDNRKTGKINAAKRLQAKL